MSSLIYCVLLCVLTSPNRAPQDSRKETEVLQINSWQQAIGKLVHAGQFKEAREKLLEEVAARSETKSHFSLRPESL